MKKPLKNTLGKAAAAIFLLVFVIGPLALYVVLTLGWPPVIGNLTAARAMREQMADRAMEVYEAMSPVTPIHKISVHYCHQGVERKGGGLRWNCISVDLPEGEALTREQVLTAPLAVT